MPVPLSQKELLAVEQSKVPGPAFLKAASSFLSCDLAKLEQKHLLESSVNLIRKSLAPREEFVLKLLLRRLSKSDDTVNGDFWTLLSHLIGTIPIKSLAHLLDERGFFESLSEALERVLAASSDEVLDAQYDTSSDEHGRRPTKKQKLSNQDAHHRTNAVLALNFAWKSIAGLVQLATENVNVDEISVSAVRSVLSAAPEDAANVVGKLLQVLQKSLTHQNSESEREHIARAVPTILSVWTYRRPDTVSSNGKSSDQHFTAQCLNPTLRLLVELQDHADAIRTSTCVSAVQALERLVALHSVLPLRSLFLAEKAQQWKNRTNSITWDDLKDLHAVIGTMLLGQHSADIEASSNISFANILQYYSVAVRAVPRPTIRRIQQEQPWLDCLFCVCAYLGDRKFPRMEVDEAGLLVVQDSMELQYSKSLNANLNKLLTLAATKTVQLSLPVLLYLSTAVLEMNINRESWLALTEIIEKGVDFLVPNSGLSGTDSLLSKIFDAISSSRDVAEIDVALVRDGLIRPLLKGYAKARDLKGFLSLWIRGLQESVQQRASGNLEHGTSHLSLIWEDEVLFKDFEAAAKALTASTVSQSMVTEVLPLLHQAAKRIGPTSDIISRVAVTTSLLHARPEDFNTAALENIFTATASALSRRSDYQLQRWRLWRLLRQCVTVSENSADMEETFQQLAENQLFISLSKVSDNKKSEYSYVRDARLKEAQECFHLTLSRTSRSQIADKSLLQTELTHLVTLFSATEASKPSKSTTYERKTELELALSCVAILSQQPQVLQHFKLAIARLIFSMIQRLSLSSDANGDNVLASLVKALLLSEEVSSNTDLFNDCCCAILNLVDADGEISPCVCGILLSIPLQALKKNVAQKFADILVQRLRSTVTAMSSLDQTLLDLGLLEMLIAEFSVSVGKPKKWAEFINLAEHVLDCTGPAASKPYQIALGCLQKMFDALWSRCQTDEMSSDMSTGLKRFQSRLHELERPVGSLLNAGTDPKLDKGLEGVGNFPDSDVFLDVSKITTKDLEHIAMHINTQVSSLGPENSSELARIINQKTLNSSDLLLLSAIICQTSTVEAAQDQSLVTYMGKLATLQFALKARTATDLTLALETGKIILDKYPSVVNQHTIDTVLSSITALTSPNTVQITSAIPSAIFNRLCALLGLVLSRHRRRLGGRYHLILPALEGLLKCLFFAGTSSTATSQTKSQVLFIRSLPSWVRGSKEPLGPKSADHFTRLLTTICDPAVSAIRRKKSNELTDETKKARSLAGQYMQYLIMDFCRCSLHGRIPSSSKEKLMPGLYAVLDAMDREVMRGMNGAMDSNGRAVWKGLYQDWERFGKWDQR